jgi:hypothetical protein
MIRLISKKNFIRCLNQYYNREKLSRCLNREIYEPKFNFHDFDIEVGETRLTVHSHYIDINGEKEKKIADSLIEKFPLIMVAGELIHYDTKVNPESSILIYLRKKRFNKIYFDKHLPVKINLRVFTIGEHVTVVFDFDVVDLHIAGHDSLVEKIVGVFDKQFRRL